MKIDVNEQILNTKGEPILDTVKDVFGQPLRGPDGHAIPGEPLTVGDLLADCLIGFGPDEKPSGSDKRKATRLSIRVVQSEGYVEFDHDEAKFLEQRIEAFGFTAVAYTRLMDALDAARGKDAEDAKAAEADEDVRKKGKEHRRGDGIVTHPGEA